MTPKMATDKVNAPAVSQLAGEITEKILQVFGPCISAKELKKLISAALSEREEKIRRETFEQCREIAMGMTGPGNTPEQCQGYSDACCDIGKAFKKLALGE